MLVNVIRKNTLFQPDASRVIARFLYATDDRSMELIKRILAFPEQKQQETLTQVLRDFSKRHRSVSRIFEKHFNRLSPLFARLGIDPQTLTSTQRVLIGSYFTMEYSLEAAAFFNPSVVKGPDQSEMVDGKKRVILSFRATGEGHISSVVFRSGVIDSDNNIAID